MPYTFTLTATIPASPEEIYQAWLDSLGHSEMTGGEATMSDQVGAEVTAWDGYISGRNLELVPGERIVQSWRTSEFGDEHEDSVVTVVLQEVGDGTLVTIEHSNVPDDQRSYEEGGWQSNYFEPMVAYFTERKEGAAETAPEEAPPRQAPPKKSAPKRRVSKTSAGKASAGKASAGKASAPKKAAKLPVKSARKAKRAASAKSKRAAPRAKALARKSKGKAKARSTARRPVKSTTRRSARGKRR